MTEDWVGEIIKNIVNVKSSKSVVLPLDDGKTMCSIPDGDYMDEIMKIQQIYSDFHGVIKNYYDPKAASGIKIRQNILKEAVDLHEYNSIDDSHEDFFDFFKGCIEHPKHLLPESGRGDIQINCVISSIMMEKDDFTIVDLGCGSGRLIEELNTFDNGLLQKINYLGVDISKEVIENAEKHSIDIGFSSSVKDARFILCDNIKNEDCRAKYIFIINTLHEVHLNELPEIIHQVYNIVDKEGYIIIHEMRSLRKAEPRAITWDEDDIKNVFCPNLFKVVVRLHETRKKLPLITAVIQKIGDSDYPISMIEENCMEMYKKKKSKILFNLSELTKNGQIKISKDDDIQAQLKEIMWLNTLNTNIDLQMDQKINS